VTDLPFVKVKGLRVRENALREWYAQEAMNRMTSPEQATYWADMAEGLGEPIADMFARLAFREADAMLEARKL